MSGELLIMRKDDKILTIRTENSRIVQIQAENAADKNILGNIYVGKVRNVVKNINAAFVEFEKGRMGYLSLNMKQCPIHADGAHYQEGRVLIGDEIIVQIEREAVKTKPPTLSGIINLPGRYIVLVSEKQRLSISSKIHDREIRNRLHEILSEHITNEYGFIARTNSADVPPQVIVDEINMLVGEYRKIADFGKHKTIFTRLYSSPTGYLSSIIDSHDEKLERIVTDDEDIYNNIKAFFEERNSPITDKLSFWDGSHGKLNAIYNITKTLEHALMPKVWLKSGAYIIIQPTEALVAIDVNTGKAVSKKKDVQKTFLKVNMEAAKEIAVQLRLRNLSGMILIDFIDMADEENNKLLMECLRHELANDNIQTSLIDMTKLGLVEVTRKKVRKSLYEQMQ